MNKIENGVTTQYIGKHYEKQVARGNVANTSYYFANGERVAEKDPSGGPYYYHSDHLHSTNVITDAGGNFTKRTVVEITLLKEVHEYARRPG